MVKYFCDVCGKETDSNEVKYSLDIDARSGGNVGVNHYIAHRQHVCPRCIEAIEAYCTELSRIFPK
jgi:hypothetical protein